MDVPASKIDPAKRYPLIVDGVETEWFVTGAVVLDPEMLRVIAELWRQDQSHSTPIPQ